MLTLALILGGVGCSLVLDPSREQCATDFDCRARGVAFEEGLCVDNLCQVNPEWSGVDAIESQAPQEAREATLKVFDIYEQTRPIPGVHVSLHTLLDYDLANPISAGDTDADGKGYISAARDVRGLRVPRRGGIGGTRDILSGASAATQ